MSLLEDLETMFRTFPGIGPRQARRFVYFLLNENPSFLSSLSGNIEKLKEKVTACSECRRYFARNHSSVCPICSNDERDHTTIMIVPHDADLIRMEDSGAYKGLYFVVGGVLSLTDKEPEKKLPMKMLEKRVKTLAPKLKEIILVSDLTPDGETTLDFIAGELSSFRESGGTISRLGRGLSTGSEIEYADSETLRNALKNRQ